MKNVFILLTIMLCALTISSCTQDDVTEELQQQEMLTTGEDGEVDDGRGNG